MDAQGETARPREGGLVVCVRECGVQSDPIAEIAADAGMMQAMCLCSAVSGSRRPWRRAFRCPSITTSDDSQHSRVHIYAFFRKLLETPSAPCRTAPRQGRRAPTTTHLIARV